MATHLDKFNPYNLSADQITRTLTGRQRERDQIEDVFFQNIQGSADQGCQAVLLLAQRGMGKSFLVHWFANYIRKNFPDVAFAQLSEEQIGIRTPGDFLRYVRKHIPGSTAKGSKITLKKLVWEEEMALLKEDIARLPDGIEGLKLIVSIENFHLLRKKVFSDERDESLLRLFLTEQPHLMVIATAIGAPVDEDPTKRIYKLFRTIRLQPWSKDDFLDYFRRVHPTEPLDLALRQRLEALSFFVGGSPRLALIFANAALDLRGAERSADVLQRVVDELTPYYQDRLADMGSIAETLLLAIVENGEAVSPSDLAASLDVSQPQIAKPLAWLNDEGFVTAEKAPGQREKYYSLTDRLFSIYLRQRFLEEKGEGFAITLIADYLQRAYPVSEMMLSAAEWENDPDRKRQAHKLTEIITPPLGDTSVRAVAYHIAKSGDHDLSKLLEQVAYDYLDARESIPQERLDTLLPGLIAYGKAQDPEPSSDIPYQEMFAWNARELSLADSLAALANIEHLRERTLASSNENDVSLKQYWQESLDQGVNPNLVLGLPSLDYVWATSKSGPPHDVEVIERALTCFEEVARENLMVRNALRGTVHEFGVWFLTNSKASQAVRFIKLLTQDGWDTFDSINVILGILGNRKWCFLVLRNVLNSCEFKPDDPNAPSAYEELRLRLAGLAWVTAHEPDLHRHRVKFQAIARRLDSENGSRAFNGILFGGYDDEIEVEGYDEVLKALKPSQVIGLGLAVHAFLGMFTHTLERHILSPLLRFFYRQTLTIGISSTTVFSHLETCLRGVKASNSTEFERRFALVAHTAREIYGDQCAIGLILGLHRAFISAHWNKSQAMALIKRLKTKHKLGIEAPKNAEDGLFWLLQTRGKSYEELERSLVKLSPEAQGYVQLLLKQSDADEIGLQGIIEYREEP